MIPREDNARRRNHAQGANNPSSESLQNPTIGDIMKPLLDQSKKHPQDQKHNYRLPRKVRRQIDHWIVAGLSNPEINQKLNDAGYPSLHRSTLRDYRNKPGVMQQVSERAHQAMQVGFAQRVWRIAALNTLMSYALARATGRLPSYDPYGPPEGQDSSVRVSNKDFVCGARMFLALSKEMSRLVDPLLPPPVVQAVSPVKGRKTKRSDKSASSSGGSPKKLQRSIMKYMQALSVVGEEEREKPLASEVAPVPEPDDEAVE
jgi:hypothetical protein